MGTPKGTKPWNAGTSKGWVDSRGYRWLYVTEYGKRRARREHRVIMEKHLGRRLEPWELVHHKDENPLNNSINNLELMEFGEHTANHHIGARKNQQARKSMEAFALVREELRQVRAINSDLLAALAEVTERLAAWMTSADEDDISNGDIQSLKVARATIAKARGET